MRETSDPFPMKERYRYIHVRVSARYLPSCASARCAAQHVATPTMSILNFRDQKSNHEIHENIVPRKFGAIRYRSFKFCRPSYHNK